MLSEKLKDRVVGNNGFSLNPCCNGRCSLSTTNKALPAYVAEVLILVVMEDTLRDFYSFAESKKSYSLNPCCNGRYSPSAHRHVGRANEGKVLILVVMEDTLRESGGTHVYNKHGSLNPCCNGRYSPRAKFTYRYISTC